jgi:predicted DNA binding protein
MKLDDSRRNITHLVEITSEKKSAKDLTKKLRRTSSVTESNVTRVGAKRVVGIVTSNNCKVGLIILKSKRKTGVVGVSQALTVSDSLMSYKLYMNGDEIPELLQSLHNGGVPYKISMIEKLAAPKAITPQQKRVLKTALELGYYATPKRISTEDLSKQVGLSPNAVSQTLRIAERKIISANSERAKPIGIKQS